MIAFLKRYLRFIFFGLACLVIALSKYFGTNSEPSFPSAVSENHKSHRKPKNQRTQREILAGKINSSSDTVVQALEIAPAEIKPEEEEMERLLPQREPSKEDSILLAGGILEKQSVVMPNDLKRMERLKSIRAEDWEGKSSLLVNALRAGNGFEVTWQDLEAFLKGQNLFGWPEGSRNWIGDEMMTMLRQEMPQQAFLTFSSIQADDSAPEAMRDYSIQHISHLVADGHAGAEGVVVIRAGFSSGDPVLASTALVSLHRLSEKKPELISPDEVRTYVESSADSPDQRLQATALAILNEADHE